jgi:putative polyketide hydroxylase
MTSAHHEEIPILIVGGGPTGLCASIAPSGFGIRSLLVEKHSSVSPFPRTRAVHRRSMEIFRRWGLANSIHDRELDLEPVIAWAPSVTAPIVRKADYVQRSQPNLSPCAMSPIFQHELEQLLLQRLASEAISDVRLSTELQSFAVHADGVEATIRNRQCGDETIVHARYMIGADGANSIVRDALGIPMSGPDNLAETC